SLWLLSFIPSSPHPQPVSVHPRTPDMDGYNPSASVDDRQGWTTLMTYAYCPGKVEGRSITVSSPCCDQDSCFASPSRKNFEDALGVRDLRVSVAPVGLPNSVAYTELPLAVNRTFMPSDVSPAARSQG